MKSGMSLEELARTVYTQEQSKQDFTVNTAVLRIETNPETKNSTLFMPSNVTNMTNGLPVEREFQVSPLFHQQVASRLNIPAQYYNRLLQDVPHVLDQNVNGLFQFQPEFRMVRTHSAPFCETPRARAFLSDRFRRLDNFDTMRAVLGVVSEIRGAGNISVETCNVSETMLSLKFLNPRLEGELRRGDAVQAGLCVRNSEVGKGSLIIQPFLYRLVCTNGMIVNEFSKRKYHAGGRNSFETDEDVQDLTIYRNETIQAANTAFWMEIQDAMRAAVDDKIFNSMIERTQQTMGIKLESPQVAVKELSNTFNFTNTESDLILRHLIEGSELTGFGLIQAVTRAAQDVPDYDRSTYMEIAGGDMTGFTRADWKQIATV